MYILSDYSRVLPEIMVILVTGACRRSIRDVRPEEEGDTGLQTLLLRANGQ